MAILKLGIVSDIHYACAAEQERGTDYEYRGLENPLIRLFVRLYRQHIWLRDPLHQGHLLEQFLNHPEYLDLIIANGDYSCDSAFVGVSDDAAFVSARECLSKLRNAFGERIKPLLGDHELGKFSLIGRHGGLRLMSFVRATGELGIEPLWTAELGKYTLVGVTSSLLALPVAHEEILPEERHAWGCLRRDHIQAINKAVQELAPDQRVLLFCHDPTALQFLWRETRFPEVLPRVEQTIVGHLHSRAVLRMSNWLKGMPELRFLGHTVRRLSRSLREARLWNPFHVRLCPSLAGIELLRDGGFYTAELDTEGCTPVKFQFHRVPR